MMEFAQNHTQEANDMSYVVLLGRILFSLIFVKSSFGHFSAGTIGYAAAQGVPLASIAVPVSGVMALLGGLSVAFGYKARFGASLLVLFLVPVTIFIHRFRGSSRRAGGDDAADHVPEESFDVGRRAPHHTFWFRAAKPGHEEQHSLKPVPKSRVCKP